MNPKDDMTLYEFATAHYSDDLRQAVADLNWLYIDSPEWVCVDDLHPEMIDFFDKPILEDAPYYLRAYQPEMDTIILSVDSMKVFLFLMYMGNLGLYRFTREDLPHQARLREQLILSGKHKSVNFHERFEPQTLDEGELDE